MDDFAQKALALVVKRDWVGATREDFFQEFRGVSYKEVETAALTLNKDGFVNLEWTGPTSFILTATNQGKEALEAIAKES